LKRKRRITANFCTWWVKSLHIGSQTFSNYFEGVHKVPPPPPPSPHVCIYESADCRMVKFKLSNRGAKCTSYQECLVEKTIWASLKKEGFSLRDKLESNGILLNVALAVSLWHRFILNNIEYKSKYRWQFAKLWNSFLNLKFEKLFLKVVSYCSNSYSHFLNIETSPFLERLEKTLKTESPAIKHQGPKKWSVWHFWFIILKHFGSHL
jgi:hypothetical protein